MMRMCSGRTRSPGCITERHAASGSNAWGSALRSTENGEPARELVPGDRVRLRFGDSIPADARLLKGDPLEADQSALTGESLPISRTAGDEVYSSSIVKRGEIDAVVSATGPGSYMGRTAQLVEMAHRVSHFQQAVLKIGDYLIVIAVALVVVILVVAVFRGNPLMTTLQFCLVLTVAAVPVAMPRSAVGHDGGGCAPLGASASQCHPPGGDG
jgi:P-type E1-E2 ATPase